MSQQPRFLSSSANPRVRHAVRLRESSRYRRRTGETILDGAREVVRAAKAGIEPTCLFIARERCERLVNGDLSKSNAGELGELLDDERWQRVMWYCEPPIFSLLAFGNRNEGVVATVTTPEPLLQNLVVAGSGPVLVLDQVEKPGNVGAVLRTADATGAGGVILCAPRTDVFNPATIRASLGTLFSVPLATGDTEQVIRWLAESGRELYSLEVGATDPPWEVDLRVPSAFLFGSEAFGLSSAWSNTTIRRLGLPMCGIADSLNVSATAAALLYESLRQRAKP